MKKAPIKQKKNAIIPLYLVLAFLSLGLLVALFQLNKQQILQSEAQMARNCDVPDLTNTPEEQMVIDRINTIRMQRNLMPIAYSDVLKRPSKWYANDLARGGTMPPMDSLGGDVVDRAQSCGIMVSMMGEELGESVRIGPMTVDEHVQALQDDPNHIFPTFTHAAVSRTGNNWVIVYSAGQLTSTAAAPTAGAPAGGTLPVSGSLGGNVPAITDAPLGTGEEQPTPCPTGEVSINDAGTTYGDDGKKKGKSKKGKGGGGGGEGGGTQGGGGTDGGGDGLLDILIKLLEQLIVLLGGTPPAPSTGTPPVATNPC